MEPHEIEVEIINLMQKLQQNEMSIENIKLQYSPILEEVNKQIEEDSAQYIKVSSEIQDRIKELALLGAKSIKTGSGNVTYRKGSVRRTWDLDKLDEVCNVDPFINMKIWQYRKETIGEPSVTIKVDTKGISITNI